MEEVACGMAHPRTLGARVFLVRLAAACGKMANNNRGDLMTLFDVYRRIRLVFGGCRHYMDGIFKPNVCVVTLC